MKVRCYSVAIGYLPFDGTEGLSIELSFLSTGMLIMYFLRLENKTSCLLTGIDIKNKVQSKKRK